MSADSHYWSWRKKTRWNHRSTFFFTLQILLDHYWIKMALMPLEVQTPVPVTEISGLSKFLLATGSFSNIWNFISSCRIFGIIKNWRRLFKCDLHIGFQQKNLTWYFIHENQKEMSAKNKGLGSKICIDLYCTHRKS